MQKQLFVSIIITLLYAVLTLLCVFHHEVWTDEVQVWQICKYLNPIEIINHLHNEGHPAFFYFIVMPFAKMSNNIIFMQIICWVMSCFAVFLLLNFSPFKMFTKICIIFTAGFLYFFPVIARNYSILPFLVFFAAILFKKQKKHPILYSVILIFIANTHIIMFGFSFILFLFFVLNIFKDNFNKSKSVQLLSVLICIIGLLTVILQLHDTGTSNYYISPDFQNIIYNIKNVSVNFIINTYNSDINEYFKTLSFLDYLVISITVINFIIIFINLYFNNKKIFAIAFVSIFSQFFIYVIAYPRVIYPTRVFSAYIIIIFCFWILINNCNINEKYKICSLKTVNITVCIMFLLTFSNGIKYYVRDINMNYSSAKQTAEYIRNNISSDAIILVEHEPSAISIAYYLNNRNKLFSVARKNELKYITWDYYTIEVLNSFDWIKEAFYYRGKYRQEELYIIRTYKENPDYNQDLFDKYFNLVYTADKSMLPNENYMIYKFK